MGKLMKCRNQYYTFSPWTFKFLQKTRSAIQEVIKLCEVSLQKVHLFPENFCPHLYSIEYPTKPY